VESLERQSVAALEPVLAVGWLSDEVRAELAALGIPEFTHQQAASRVSPMGSVGRGVAVSVFYNFNPNAEKFSVFPALWATATPADVLAADRRAVDAALGPALAGIELGELAGLMRQAADDAALEIHGRPLAAGIADLPWPDEPHLQIWQAQFMLREYRGDGHATALLEGGLSGIESLVVHAARDGMPAELLRGSRRWPQDAWDDAVDALRSRGWIDEGPDLALSDEGRRRRDEIERMTDVLAAPAYESIGPDGLARVIELAAPVAAAAVPVGVGKMRPTDIGGAPEPAAPRPAAPRTR
jgi:hypothetical protein